MWRCSNCGEEVEDDFEVCWNCQSGKDGTRQTISQLDGHPGITASAVVPQKICPNCGRKADADTKYCKYCDVPVQDKQPLNWKPIIIGVIVLVILLIAGGVNFARLIGSLIWWSFIIGVVILIVLALRSKKQPATYFVTLLFFLVGGATGGGVAFLLRPSAPLIGQLDLETVVSRGSRLRGVDQLLVPTAEASFNILVVGVILGGAIGAIVGIARSRREGSNNSQMRSRQTQPTQQSNPESITERLRTLAELKDEGVLSEEEFQEKKSELLKRL